jgi:hypothetical protein
MNLSVCISCTLIHGLTEWIELDEPPFEDVDPERLAECRYWRCQELFERRTANHRFCRKACRSRQKKWERSVERKRLKRTGTT